jgi:hypothetical protein
MQRPGSVTAACWVIIAISAEAIAGSYSSLLRDGVLRKIADPHVGMPTTVLASTLLQLAIIALASFMLRGANWARIAYTVTAGFVLLALAVTTLRVTGVLVILFAAIARTAVVLYVLYRPEANAYFRGATEAQPLPQSEAPLQQTDA